MRMHAYVLPLAMACGMAAAAPALAEVDRSGYQTVDISSGRVTFTSFADFTGASLTRAADTFYSSMGTDGTFGFSTAVSGGGAISDGYTGDGSVVPQPIATLREMRLAGGVSNAAGDVVAVDFFDVFGSTHIGGFFAGFTDNSLGVWVFNLTGLGINAGRDGVMKITSSASGTFRWFETNEAVDRGGNGSPDVFAFELSGVPTPGAVSLLGLAGLAAARRRR